MEIQLINITSYIGISAEAEHFYAKVANPGRHLAETLSFENSGADLEHICGYHCNEALRYFPTKEEAEAYAKKDYPDYDRTMDDETRKRCREVAIGDLLEYGTIRFPSLLSVIKTAREKWPSAYLYFTLEGCRKSFLKMIFEKDMTHIKPEYEEYLLPKNEEDHADTQTGEGA